MNEANGASPGRQFTGWHFLILIVAFFAVIIGVNVYMAVEAERTWTGVVVDDSYASGQDFNERVKLVREQDALGWHERLTYAAGTLTLQVLGRDDRPLPFAGVSVALSRPLGDSEDRTVVLTRAADGSFTAAVGLRQGTWNAVVTATDTPHGIFERHEQLVLH
ncbi:MAG: FixH family protein [Devosia sp.]|nr:FixH family protein [Devosia sp.]